MGEAQVVEQSFDRVVFAMAAGGRRRPVAVWVGPDVVEADGAERGTPISTSAAFVSREAG